MRDPRMVVSIPRMGWWRCISDILPRSALQTPGLPIIRTLVAGSVSLWQSHGFSASSLAC
jgi:hypothetical protein